MAEEKTRIKALCEKFNLTQAGLARRFGIHQRNVEKWCAGDRKPPDYVPGMMEEILEHAQADSELAAYKETGLTPEQINAMKCYLLEVISESDTTVNICTICLTQDCTNRGGQKPCNPVRRDNAGDRNSST